MQRLIAAALVLIFVPLVALALYADLGRPDMPDEPLASRKADATTAEGVEAAVARLEAHLTASPDDGKGWEVIGPVYMRLGRFDDAVNAFREVLKLDGESASRRADYGEALVAAAGGVVTADARAAFDKALAEQPGQIAARFYLGLAAEQDGDKPKAIAAYKGLLSEAPDDAPWAATVKKRLAALEGGAAPSGPASAAPDDAHQKSIREVVGQLAKRLAQSGGDAGQWQQLIRSYAVLNEPDKARDALAAARKALAGDAAAGPGLDSLAQKLGLEGADAAANAAPPAPTASAPPAAPAAPAADVATDDQQTMIRGMVERLATRLAQSGGDASEWQRLIRAYSVLHEPDKARQALASARKALAGDAAAGPGLDALAQELGIGG
jgi:cytochrome c-type biogenesis protein CcmH/NrfG